MDNRTRTLQPLLPVLVAAVEVAGDARHQRIHGQPNIRVRDEQTGRPINVTFAEDTTFWDWACIQALRHAGAQNEEVLELSQLGIRQCVRPNGEVIALLVIAPSKTDRERVIPMTAELFHVIATIIRRLIHPPSRWPPATTGPNTSPANRSRLCSN